jgi:hypothetical protein
LLAAFSGLLGYKVTISTMSLIDADPSVVSAHGIDIR